MIIVVYADQVPHNRQNTNRPKNRPRTLPVRHNIPFHINLFNSVSFQAGRYDTRFVEERFSMTTYESEPTDEELETIAIAATLHAHKSRQKAAQVVAPAERDTSNWKWMGRYERIHR